MGSDEEGTLARLKAVRKALVDPTIAAHRGRIVKTTGDGMLVEFSSAVDAVRGAVEVQGGMAEQNASVPQDDRIEFRIGIHVGDIIIDDNDIFGDGVNVAARCEPGECFRTCSACYFIISFIHESNKQYWKKERPGPPANGRNARFGAGSARNPQSGG
jgi:hypothetical protein